MKLEQLNKTDLTKHFKIHNKLNPKFWENEQLKPSIHKHIMNIIDKFIDVKKIDFKFDDIILIGSSCDINYTNHSDIDIHLVMNVSEDDLEYQLMVAVCKEWNKFNLTAFNHKIEINPQTKKADGLSKNAAMYSLTNNKWIRKPNYHFEITNKMREHINKQVHAYIDKATQYIKNKDGNSLRELMNTIKDKRKDAVAVDGEMAISNLVFKALRNHGQIDEWSSKIEKFDIIEPLSIK